MIRFARLARFARMTFAALAVSALVPSVALAEDSVIVRMTPDWVRFAVGALGLIVAVVLLVEALRVRRVASGGVVADKISYVILGIVCLAGSAILEWGAEFTTGFTMAQLQYIGEILVIVAMAFLAAYFYSVRKGMQGYIDSATAASETAEEAATGA
jgi:hypothetical protein